MKMLVTGGAGFIGSHLCDALMLNGDEVVILDDFSTGLQSNVPARAHVTRGCITNAAHVKEAMAGCGGVFHLAAIASVTQSIEQWSATHRINQSGAVEVFEQAADLGIPVVYASSAAVYGDSANLPLKETNQISALSPYGLDKFACEMQAQMGYQVRALQSVGLRFFNVYGSRQNPASHYSGVISLFVNALKYNHAINIFGDGEQTRDFIYVADVVTALIAAMRKLQSKNTLPIVSNVCTGNVHSINQLAQQLCTISQKKTEIIYHDARLGDIKHSKGCPKKMNSQLGAFANVTLNEGLTALWKSL